MSPLKGDVDANAVSRRRGVHEKNSKKFLYITTGTHGNISPDIKSFFEYVNQHAVTSDFTKEIDKKIFHIKSDQKARLEYMSLETYVQDNRYEAYAEGEAKGLAKGEAQEKFATVKRMLKRGKSSLIEIAEDTDLPLDTIKKIQAEMQAV